MDNVSKIPYYSGMTGFTKLFSSIVHSTIWRDEMHVKIVWITMLALSNRNGDVLASIPGLADASRVSLDQCLDALKRLSEPDEWSRTKEYEGRRIQEVDGGWNILNYMKYREIRNADERRLQTRAAVQKFRAKKKAETITVSQGQPRKAHAEAEAEADKETSLGPQVALARKRFQSVYPGRKGTQRWPKARQRFDSLVRKGVDPGLLVSKAQAYATFCVASGKVDSEFVMQAATFLGDGGGWEEDWAAKSESQFDQARRQLQEQT
jgi:hypothetical protein